MAIGLIEVNVEAVATWPTNRNRHVFGPKEELVITTNPSVELSCDPVDGILINGNTITAPDRPGYFFVMMTVGEASAWLPLRCIAPTMLRGAHPRPFYPREWGDADPLSVGEAGVDMHIDTWLEPVYVSFEHLRLHEGYAPPTNRTGWYLDYHAFPLEDIEHGSNAGAMGDNGSVGILSPSNLVGSGDCVAAVIGWRPAYTNGSYQLSIPLKWFAKGGSYTNNLPDNIQTAWVYSNGTMRVSKNGCAMERTTNDNYRVISGQ